MLTRTGTHDYPPCGRAWAGLGAIARAFDRGTGLAILLPRSAPHTTGQVALAAPGAFRLDSLPPTLGLVRQECRCAVAEGSGTTAGATAVDPSDLFLLGDLESAIDIDAEVPVPCSSAVVHG